MQLAILFGGESFEHEISIISAITIKKLLQNPIFIFLNDEQDFYLIPSEKMEASYFSSGSYKKEKKLHLIKNGFKIDSFMFKSNIENLKILNLIHGGQGENGEIFSLFNFYKIPIISPNREASILSYNKKLTKIFANSVNVKTLDYEILEIRGNRKIKNLQYPIIVKPLNLGSSLGVSVVKKAEDLEYALDSAFEFDENIIVEPFVENVQELNIAGTFTDKLIFSNIEEPTKKDILDFETKYMDFSRDETVKKANISNELEKKIQDAFEKLYLPIFKGSLIRCDFFVIDNEVYLNEINSVPGSLANYLFSNFSEIIENIYIPDQQKIEVNYKYINQIKKAKG